MTGLGDIRLYEAIGRMRETADQLQAERDQLKAENAKLLEQTELLVTLLRNDCDIEASWDGLRHFWSIELTEDGCLMRDRACKAEAENAKLREMVKEALMANKGGTFWEYFDPYSFWAGWCKDAHELGIEVPE